MTGTRPYDLAVVPHTHCVLACWTFFALYWLCYSGIGDRLYALARPVDSVSQEVYIVHYCLIAGVLSLAWLTGSMPANTAILVAGIAALSAGLKWTGGWPTRAIAARHPA